MIYPGRAQYSQILYKYTEPHWGFPGSRDSKESACNAGNLDSVSGLGRCHGEGNGYPLQYSYLENFMDRGDWWATVHGVTKSLDDDKQDIWVNSLHADNYNGKVKAIKSRSQAYNQTKDLVTPTINLDENIKKFLKFGNICLSFWYLYQLVE